MHDEDGERGLNGKQQLFGIFSKGCTKGKGSESAANNVKICLWNKWQKKSVKDVKVVVIYKCIYACIFLLLCVAFIFVFNYLRLISVCSSLLRPQLRKQLTCGMGNSKIC